MRLLILFLLFSYSALSMEEITDFGENPGKLRMFLHVPANLQTPAPMVVALHGCLQDAQELARISSWNELADRYGFIVLYPEQRAANNMERCFNWFILKDIEGANGELASIRSMMDHAAQRVKVDDTRIYTYGLSAGAAMANSLMANAPTDFSGGAILAGGPHRSAVNAWQALRVMNNPDDLSPKEWWEKLPNAAIGKHPGCVIVVHGTKDFVVDPRNAREIVDQWSYAFGIDTIADYRDENFANNPAVERLEYKTTNGEKAIIQYTIRELGHQLPVDPGSATLQGGAESEFSVDIDFFSTWYIALDFGLIPSQ